MAAAQCSLELELDLYGLSMFLRIDMPTAPMPLSTIADPGGSQQAMLSRVLRYDSSHGLSPCHRTSVTANMLQNAQRLHLDIHVLMCAAG